MYLYLPMRGNDVRTYNISRSQNSPALKAILKTMKPSLGNLNDKSNVKNARRNMVMGTESVNQNGTVTSNRMLQKKIYKPLHCSSSETKIDFNGPNNLPSRLAVQEIDERSLMDSKLNRLNVDRKKVSFNEVISTKLHHPDREVTYSTVEYGDNPQQRSCHDVSGSVYQRPYMDNETTVSCYGNRDAMYIDDGCTPRDGYSPSDVKDVVETAVNEYYFKKGQNAYHSCCNFVDDMNDTHLKYSTCSGRPVSAILMLKQMRNERERQYLLDALRNDFAKINAMDNSHLNRSYSPSTSANRLLGKYGLGNPTQNTSSVFEKDTLICHHRKLGDHIPDNDISEVLAFSIPCRAPHIKTYNSSSPLPRGEQNITNHSLSYVPTTPLFRTSYVSIADRDSHYTPISSGRHNASLMAHRCCSLLSSHYIPSFCHTQGCRTASEMSPLCCSPTVQSQFNDLNFRISSSVDAFEAVMPKYVYDVKCRDLNMDFNAVDTKSTHLPYSLTNNIIRTYTPFTTQVGNGRVVIHSSLPSSTLSDHFPPADDLRGNNGLVSQTINSNDSLIYCDDAHLKTSDVGDPKTLKDVRTDKYLTSGTAGSTYLFDSIDEEDSDANNGHCYVKDGQNTLGKKQDHIIVSNAEGPNPSEDLTILVESPPTSRESLVVVGTGSETSFVSLVGSMQ